MPWKWGLLMGRWAVSCGQMHPLRCERVRDSAGTSADLLYDDQDVLKFRQLALSFSWPGQVHHEIHNRLEGSCPQALQPA